MADDAQHDAQIAGLAQRWHCRAAIAGANVGADESVFKFMLCSMDFGGVSSRRFSKICE